MLRRQLRLAIHGLLVQEVLLDEVLDHEIIMDDGVQQGVGTLDDNLVVSQILAFFLGDI